MNDKTDDKQTGSFESVGTKTTVAGVLGEITWLLTQSNRHRNGLFVGDLEWLVMPAILNGQHRIFRAADKPIGAALWAFVSPEVETRLEQGFGKLKPDEWRSGTQAWLVELIAPFGHSDKMLEELKAGPLAGQAFKCHRTDGEGRRQVVTYEGTKAGD